MIEIIPNWHPLVVHFAIALLLTAAALFVLGTAAGERPAGRAATVAARWNLALGVLAAAATLATGWQAYNTVAHDAPSHANMTTHMQWAFGTAAVFLAAAGAAWLDRRRAAGAGWLLLSLVLAGSAGLAVTGWLGGENVYRFGLGVRSLPKSDSHIHPGADGPAAAEGHVHPDAGDGHAHSRAEPATPSTSSEAPQGTNPPKAEPPARTDRPASPDGHSHKH